MSDEINPTPAEPVEGAGTSTEQEGAGSTPPTEDAPRFKQADVDRIVTARLAEEKVRLQKRYERELADKLAEKETSLEVTVQERLDAALKARELEATRAGVISEFGLSERQAAVLSGATAEELRAEAEELFGAAKKPQPPIVPSGSSSSSASGPGVFTRSQLKDPAFYAANRDAIMQAASEGRISDD